MTQQVEKVLASANDEAARLNHEYIGTEHVLLALAADREGVAVAALQNLGVNLTELRVRIDTAVKRGPADAKPLATRPQTSRLKRALDLATASARELGHSYLGAQHLLLGLVDERKGIAAQILWTLGVRSDEARAEIARIIGHPPHS